MANFWKKANAAKKRMIRGALVALVVYELVFGGAMWWVSREKLSDGGLLWLAVLPTLTVAAFILVLARYLKEEVDEFHRELVVRCLLWGTAAVMLMMALVDCLIRGKNCLWTCRHSCWPCSLRS